MVVREARDLLRHMEWADALIWSALLGLPATRREPDLHERLYHLHAVQWTYLKIWRGQVEWPPGPGAFADLESLNAWARDYYRELSGHLGALQDSDLARPVVLPWAEQVVKRLGSMGPADQGECVLQVVLHSAHHRGQAATRIRELGGEPPLMDYIGWIWMGRPAPPWKSGASG